MSTIYRLSCGPLCFGAFPKHGDPLSVMMSTAVKKIVHRRSPVLNKMKWTPELSCRHVRVALISFVNTVRHSQLELTSSMHPIL